MYAPSNLLNQVEQQVRREFADQITYFESFHEDEYTTIMVEIRSTALQIPVGDRIGQIVDTIVADQYIVATSVVPIESVGSTDGLFNLTYYGGDETFFLDYYAPERPRSNPFRVSIYYYFMVDAVPTIHTDSAFQLWDRLFRPIQLKLAKHKGVESFCKHHLAFDLRDFLLQHLDFIKHIAAAKGKSLQIIEPVVKASSAESSNGHQLEAPRTKGAPEAMALQPVVAV
ncbi:MAG: hypothetical protein ACPGWR_18580 [Ardenticatenaceae bacterium]